MIPEHIEKAEREITLVLENNKLTFEESMRLLGAMVAAMAEALDIIALTKIEPERKKWR